MKKQLLALMIAGLSLNAFAKDVYYGGVVPTEQPPVTMRIVDLDDRGVDSPIHEFRGKSYVAGVPGHRYAMNICNQTNGRVLTVLSVDGLNVISGEPASPSQSGYVLDPGACADIKGWRKSMKRVAEFYFTDPGASYAERRNKGGNTGLIGMAVFYEKPAPVSIAKELMDSAADMLGASRSAPSASAKSELGTGHGNQVVDRARQTEFERDWVRPYYSWSVQYDTYDNLVRQGVIRSQPQPPREPNPWPGQQQQKFAPDPKY